MPMLTRPAFGPAIALAYVTGGTLLCVWTLVWYFTRTYELDRTQWFWLSGFFLTGFTFVFLGLVLGPLGRAARQAELPPVQATQREAAIQQTAAAHPPAVAANMGAAPGVALGAAPAANGNAAMNPGAPAPPAQPAPAQ